MGVGVGGEMAVVVVEVVVEEVAVVGAVDMMGELVLGSRSLS